MSAGKDLVLGYDFGTSAVKAALYDRTGGMVASAAAPYGLSLPASGWAEQNPQDWWSAMAVATRSALNGVQTAAGRIAALGISAQMCGVVPVDKSGAALNNCLIWLDTRSSGIAQRLMAGWPVIAGYGALPLLRWLRLTGGAPNLSGKDPISKIVWLRENAPECWTRVHKLLDVKDYLVHRCTGRFVTSFDCAHLTWLFDARLRHKQWSASLLHAAEVDKDLLPEVCRATELAGGLTATAAEWLGLAQGTPVATGLGDVYAAALGAGAPERGSLHFSLGTSAWFGTTLAKSKVDPLCGIGSICCADGEDYLLIATQENAGACVKWAMEILGFSAESHALFEAAAAGAQPRTDSPMFFPWLYGERVPIDDKHVRGGFANLSIAHSRGDIARAVYEGVALNARWAMGPFDRLSQRAGAPLRIVGGGAQSALWCRILCDVLQRPLELIEAPQLCGALGSAMVASVVGAWHPNLAAAAAMTRTARMFSPDPGLADFYAERFALFTKFYKRLRPWYRRVAVVAAH